MKLPYTFSSMENALRLHCPPNSLPFMDITHFLTIEGMLSNREFKMPRRRQQRERQNMMGFLCISLPSLHDYDGKMPNFAFYGGRKQAAAKFSFSF